AQVVRGTVVDAMTSKPLVGVTIEEKGVKNATSTNEKGEYTLTVRNDQAVLIFTYVGYTTEEVVVGSQTTINMQLSVSAGQMGEVLIVGFGTQKKQYVTGSITQIGAKELENRPINNVGQALQGLAPNLNVNVANGAPNTTPS